MKKIVIATHHSFASGIKDTLQYITGYQEVYDISAYMDDVTLETQLDQLETKFKEDDIIIFFTDMLGGSVNQQITSRYLNRAYIITGFNLLTLMAITLMNDEDINVDSLESIVNESKEQIILMNKLKLEDNEEDE
jgi:mannose/fructose-specific phosphotransferase system component IIA